MCRRYYFLFLILFLIGCAITPISERPQLAFVKQDKILAMSEENYQHILSQSKVSTDVQKTEMVRRVGSKIATAAESFLKDAGRSHEIQNYHWEFQLIESDQVNAFCMPGGKIAVFTGILPFTKNEEGLAVVMGHEVAHALANHSNEQISQQILVQMGQEKLSSLTASKSEKTQKVLANLYGTGTKLGVLLPYGRFHESEADRIGLILMAKAGYHPQNAISFWKRMDQAKKEKLPQFLSTHPSGENRIANLQNYMEEALIYYKK